MFSKNRVYAMRKKGELIKVFETTATTGPIEEVRWKEDRIWVLTKTDGLRVFSLGGKRP